jgi:hypothetical protein
MKANQTCTYASSNRSGAVALPETPAETREPVEPVSDLEPQRLPSIPRWHNSPKQGVRYANPPSDSGRAIPTFLPHQNHQGHQGLPPTNNQDVFTLNSDNAVPPDNPQQVMSPEMSTYAATAFSLGSNDSLVARSTSSQPTFNVAISRWFDMLVGDAALESALPDFDIGMDDRNSLDTPRDPNRNSIPCMGSVQGTPEGIGVATSPSSSSPQLLERSAPGSDRNAVAEKMRWQSPTTIDLLPYEHFIFRNFVQGISHWVCQP